MTQEGKNLLLKDLSARVLYKPKALVNGHLATILGIDENVVIVCIDGNDYKDETVISADDNSDDVKPYLRPLSSITKEELHEVQQILGKGIEIHDVFISIVDSSINTFSYLELQAVFDWFNAHHLDYRGLIPMNLAFEAPEGMYETK